MDIEDEWDAEAAAELAKIPAKLAAIEEIERLRKEAELSRIRKVIAEHREVLVKLKNR